MDIKFGYALPVFANPGVPYFRTPNLETLAWQELVHSVREAESLGYNSIWAADHLFIGSTGETFECWTALSALASVTKEMRLGTIHLGNLLRHPTVVAKMAATLDVISGGRLDLFLEQGWRLREHEAYGLPWYDGEAVRTRRLEESIAAMKLLWSGEPVNYQGEHVQLREAVSSPKPIQTPNPPIWLGDSFTEEGRALIVSEADVWNSMPASVDVLRDKIALLDEACERAGREPSSLRKTLETQVLIYEDEAEGRAMFRHFEELSHRYPAGPFMSDVIEFVLRGNPLLAAQGDIESLKENFLLGTVDEVSARLEEYAALGVEEIICWFMDYPRSESMHRLATLFRGRSSPP